MTADTTITATTMSNGGEKKAHLESNTRYLVDVYERQPSCRGLLQRIPTQVAVGTTMGPTLVRLDTCAISQPRAVRLLPLVKLHLQYLFLWFGLALVPLNSLSNLEPRQDMMGCFLHVCHKFGAKLQCLGELGRTS